MAQSIQIWLTKDPRSKIFYFFVNSTEYLISGYMAVFSRLRVNVKRMDKEGREKVLDSDVDEGGTVRKHRTRGFKKE